MQQLIGKGSSKSPKINFEDEVRFGVTPRRFLCYSCAHHYNIVSEITDLLLHSFVNVCPFIFRGSTVEYTEIAN